MCSIMGYCGPVQDWAAFHKGFDRTLSRGPDESRVLEVGGGALAFHRLAIMGLTEAGMQPFRLGSSAVVCNGEIYGFAKLRAELERKGYAFSSGSDCEVLLPLYREYGTGMFRLLDAEFALILYDGERGEFLAARDPIGIRPLYYGYDRAGTILFASEPKNLVGLCETVLPFPPGCYYQGGQFHRYRDMTQVERVCHDDVDTACRVIHDKLVAGVEKRLVADAQVGFLLSGGLDSSLVCAIAARKSAAPIRTFAIGMVGDAIDLKYARQVADFLGSHHTEVYMTPEEVVGSLEEVIALLGTFDITTIRASMGMYLVCKYIHENTDIRVLLTGEISDELFGYKYTDFAPSPGAFQAESEKRVRELHTYDVLRADRCISVNSSGGPGALWGPGLRGVRHVPGPGPESEHHRQGEVPAAQGFCPGGLPPRSDPVAGEGRLLRRGGPLHGGLSERVRRDPVHRRGLRRGLPKIQPCQALYQGVPAVPGHFRTVLPRPGGHDPGLLDAQQGLGGLRRGRPLRPGAGKLRGQREIGGTLWKRFTKSAPYSA